MSGEKAGPWLAIVASLVVIATLAVAITVMGPPSEQREAKLDRKRVQDLQRIVLLVDSYAETHNALPPDLDTLAGQPGRRLSIGDPVDGSRYTYAVTGDRTFRLCATFTTDTGKTPEGTEPWAGDEWSHGAGRQCFDRKAKRP